MTGKLIHNVFPAFLILCLLGCKTVYEGPVERRLPGEQVSKGQVLRSPVTMEQDESLRSSNYRYSAVLPKRELDRMMAAMEQYHLRMYKALQPPMKKVPEYIDVVIPATSEGFSQCLKGNSDALVESGSVAVLFSKRKIIVLHEDEWSKFSRKLYRAQVWMFFREHMSRLPAWLEEGMISFFEEVVTDSEGGLRIVGYNAEKMAGVQEVIEAGEFPSLENLSGMHERESLGDKDKLAAWAFVYWGQHSGRKSKESFKKYLSAVLEKGFEKTDIESFISMKTVDFDKRWKEWLLKQEVYLGKNSRGQIERKR